MLCGSASLGSSWLSAFPLGSDGAFLFAELVRKPPDVGISSFPLLLIDQTGLKRLTHTRPLANSRHAGWRRASWARAAFTLKNAQALEGDVGREVLYAKDWVPSLRTSALTGKLTN